MKTNDDSIKWVVERLQALNQEHEEARRADRVVDHAACRIASETCLQELLRAYDRLDEAQAEVERLQAEVDRLRGPHRHCYQCLEDLPQGATDDCCDGCRDQLRRDEEAE